jgi:uncharacterized repeat protein (TIGR01451 family)
MADRFTPGTRIMSRINKLEQNIHGRRAAARRTQKRAAHLAGGQSSLRCRVGVERLEDRVTPSILGTFELDGNGTTGVLGASGSTATSHDWDQIFADNNAGSPFVSGALASSFVTDAVNSAADDIFAGGTSKDTLGIQQGPWLFTGSKPQAKTDIAHAYSAAYIDPSNGHLLLYAGLDRFDNSGNAAVGFWFLKNAIDKNPSVTINNGHPFIGTHADGDILLVSDFTVGGSISTIRVYRWTGTDAAGSLVALNNGNPINGSTFAIVNSGPISVPWSFTNKSGQSQPAAGEFLEEGADLTALGLQGSFATFVAETRSSQSPHSSLSDFVIGNLPVPSLSASPFSAVSQVGDSVTYPLTVHNTGATPLFIQSVSDTLLGNVVVNHVLQPPGAAGIDSFVTAISSAFDFSQPLAPGAYLTIFVTRTVQATDPDPTNSTVTFIGTDDLAGQLDQIIASANNSVNLFQPSASLTETTSDSSATALGQIITYTFTVSNTSSADSPNLVLDLSNPNDSFTDTLLGNLEPDAIHAATGDNSATIASIAPGTTFTFTKTRAVQAGDPTPLTDTASVAFSLAQNLGIFTNISAASASASVTLVPHLQIAKAVTPGFTDVIHPGDTASFTITVTNDGAGPATNVVVTDQMPAADLLFWNATSSAFSTSVSAGDFLTATISSLPAGATSTIVVSALIPLDVFGPTGAGSGSGDPVAAGVFELDGNATTGVLGTSGSTTTSHDWDQVFNDAMNVTSTSGAIAANFVTDPISTTSDDIFTGGGSKDTNGIQQGPWRFTNSKPQGKDDIEHAFAATYTDPSNGHLLLFAGMDRFDNSGDSTAGFWFLQNPVGLSTNNPPPTGGAFTGTHRDGDILLVSDFTVGGSVSALRVFRWTGDDSTGSLVSLNGVNPIIGSTFVIVNSGSISVPWTFIDKSLRTSPGAGEFLEEGLDLTALGLGGCFSSFLAETRSSVSPTATLSDFVIGSFNTCRLPLPNSATAQADSISPITTNQVVITVVDGAALQAPSVAGGEGAESLTMQQLQSAVTQGIIAWRAAGIDSATLSNLDQVRLHLANLPGGELGFTAGGEIWIDQTAAGWGWAVNGGSGMDLLTVVSHELGHVLGFEHSGTGVMEAALPPGVRRVPEALVTSAAVPGISRAGELGVAQLSVSPTTMAHKGTIEAALAIGVHNSVAPAPAVQDGPSRVGVPLTALVASPAVVSVGADRDFTSTLVPALRPTSAEAALDDDHASEQMETLPTQPIALVRQRASDACFAGGSWEAGPDAAQIPPAANPAAAALAVVLGGWWGARPAAIEPRKRQRFLIDSI